MNYKFYTINITVCILEDASCVNSPIYEQCVSIQIINILAYILIVIIY